MNKPMMRWTASRREMAVARFLEKSSKKRSIRFSTVSLDDHLRIRPHVLDARVSLPKCCPLRDARAVSSLSGENTGQREYVRCTDRKFGRNLAGSVNEHG